MNKCFGIFLLTTLVVTCVSSQEPERSVALCRALESVQEGDRVRVMVSGVYASDYFFDPNEMACRTQIAPITCVRFSPEFEFPPAAEKLKAGIDTPGLKVVFGGVLHGPPFVGPADSRPSATIEGRKVNRVQASVERNYCRQKYSTVLVVDELLSYSVASPDTSYPSIPEDTVPPVGPLSMALPTYPVFARMAGYEGVAIVRYRIADGSIAEAWSVFGDELVADDAVAFVRSWKFQTEVSGTRDVEIRYRLDTNTAGSNSSTSITLMMPDFVEVTAPRLIR